MCTDHVAAVSETRSDVTSEVYVCDLYIFVWCAAQDCQRLLVQVSLCSCFIGQWSLLFLKSQKKAVRIQPGLMRNKARIAGPRPEVIQTHNRTHTPTLLYSFTSFEAAANWELDFSVPKAWALWRTTVADGWSLERTSEAKTKGGAIALT